MAKLHDEFAEVRFHDVEAGVFERVVQVNLLARHRLGLDDGLRFFVTDNLQNDFPRLRRRAGPMNFCSARFNFGNELFEVFVELIERVPFCFGGKLARALPVLKRRRALVPGDLVIAQRRANDLAMAQIARHQTRLLHELRDESHAGKVLTLDGHG